MAPMLRTALGVLFIVSTQVVSSLAGLKPNFTDVHQCESFTFTITGQNPESRKLPTSLSVIAFGSNPVVIPFPNPQLVPGGTFSTFLPFSAGTRFVASLEDGSGENMIARVSDVMTVLPSQNGNDNSCVDQNPNPIRQFAILEGSISQCQEFTLSYNTTVVPQAPRIRVYNPRGFSFSLNNTSEDPTTGTAKYLMNVSGGKEVVLLIDGGNGIRETTELLTVEGLETLNTTECLAKQREVEAAMDRAEAVPRITPTAIIIGGSAGGGAVILLAVAMCIFVVRERKRKRRANGGPSVDGRKQSKVPTFVVSPAPRGSTPDPTNQNEKYLASTKRPSLRPNSLASWVQATPEDQRRNPRYLSTAPSLAISESRNVMPQSVDDRDRLSINSLDIEGMLNMATLQTEASRKNSSTTFAQDLASASPPKPRIYTDVNGSQRRVLVVNSDIPDDLRSAYSRDSLNPFSTLDEPMSRPTSNANLTVPPMAHSPSRPSSPFARLLSGLSSPQDVGESPARAPLSRNNSTTSGSYYQVGVAR